VKDEKQAVDLGAEVPEPSRDICLQVLNEKLAAWQKMYYSEKVNGKVSLAIEDQVGVKRAKETMAKCLTAIGLLEVAITEKTQEEEEGDAG